MKLTENQLNNFLKKINKVSGECWQWKGATVPAGYGYFHTNNKSLIAHRVAYELFKGEIPEGLQIDHLCMNRGCVNPDHLESVTPRVNTLRSFGIAAKNAVKTHCPQGHPYDEENTFYRLTKYGGQGRNCKICRMAHNKLPKLRKEQLAKTV